MKETDLLRYRGKPARSCTSQRPGTALLCDLSARLFLA